MTSRVMRSATVRAKKRSLCAASRTMSRSERIPTGRSPWTAMSAPMLWRASSAGAPPVDSSGGTVTRAEPPRARIVARALDGDERADVVAGQQCERLPDRLLRGHRHGHRALSRENVRDVHLASPLTSRSLIQIMLSGPSGPGAPARRREGPARAVLLARAG